MEKLTLLQVDNLEAGYSGLSVTKKIGFSLKKRESIFISGKNASGKTTIVKTLLGQLEPIRGRYQWMVSKDEISYLPQISTAKIPSSITTKEILDVYPGSEHYHDLVVDQLLDKRWIDLSGGERQKILILTRLSSKTKVLILDEPFNHLDALTIELFSDVFSKLKEKGIAFIVISHHNPELFTKHSNVVEL